MNACVGRTTKKSHNNALLITHEEERPWGSFQKFTENALSTVKRITVNPFGKLSLQSHNNRDELWEIVKGKCLITIGEKVYAASEGDKFLIPHGIKHRIEAKDLEVKVLEISFGIFDEDDIVRFEDEYGRV